MICYATTTGTKRNLAALRAASWRLFLSSAGRWSLPDGFRYALDNGAWAFHQQGLEFDEDLFARFLRRYGLGADFIIAPDIVAGGDASLALSEAWIPHLEQFGSLILIAVQDGMKPSDLRGMFGPKRGIFLGGSTEWKLETMPEWGALAASVGAYYHVGRVNTARRIRMAHAAGASSIDGTSASRFAKTLPPLDRAARQRDLLAPVGRS